MTIAQRLVLLLAIPLLALAVLGYLGIRQIARIESTSSIIGMRVRSLTSLGDIHRDFSEARVNIRTYLLSNDTQEQQKAVADLQKKGFEVIQSGKIGQDEFYYMDTEKVFGVVWELGNVGQMPHRPTRRYPA